MTKMLIKTAAIAVMIIVAGMCLGMGAGAKAYAESVIGSSASYGIMVATGHAIMADNVLMQPFFPPTPPSQKKCYDTCRKNGGTKSYCHGKCGMPAAG